MKHYVDLSAPFMTRDMRRYWADFLASYALLMLGLALLLTQSFLPALIGYAVAALAAYRCASFIHEISHFPPRQAAEENFKIAWNLLFGIWVLTPSCSYDSHLDHHATHRFGTEKDPEYVPIKDRSVWGLAGFVYGHTIAPASMMVVRLALNPVIWLSDAVEQRMETIGKYLTIRWAYRRETRDKRDGFDRLSVVLATAILYGATILLFSGVVPVMVALKIALVLATSGTLNGLRTLVAHRYDNVAGRPLDRGEQLLDSVNLQVNPIIGTLLAPVGLRFHALHHLVPMLPYHGLARAHANLMRDLPADDPYRRVTATSFTQAFTNLRASLPVPAAAGG